MLFCNLSYRYFVIFLKSSRSMLLLRGAVQPTFPFDKYSYIKEIKIPVLVIVAEGDLSTLDHVVKVLKRGIPVLVLKGSGKAADLIAECIDK